MLYFCEVFMKKAKWITAPCDMGAAAVAFSSTVNLSKNVESAVLRASAVGLYELTLDGKRVGDRVLTPGFTSYEHRVMYQEYDVTDSLCDKSTLCISVGPGWAVGTLGFTGHGQLYSDCTRAVCELEVTYADGTAEIFGTDGSWSAYTHEVTFSDIYNGETVDKSAERVYLGNAVLLDDGKFPLVPDNGAPVREQERIAPASLIITPRRERVIDFGQNMTGYVSLRVKGERGSRVVLSHAEVLDGEGNFYNDNYREAKNTVTYILSGGDDFFKPRFSFQGFRYVRIDEYPNAELDLDGFEAVVVHTEMKRIGYFVSGNPKINQLYHNIIWGQKSNYLDIPTDCPQRDERLGWTGDAMVFCRTAGINYDVRKFFEKWLTDLRIEQREDGAVWGTCPEQAGMHRTVTRISTGWGDIATVAPWTLYELYGDKKVLLDNFEMMRKWVEYMHSAGDEEYLWLSGYHYGDWLAMDAGEDSYVGATSNDLVASAFFAHSVELLVKAGEALGKDMKHYREMHANIVKAFREYFMENGMPKSEFPLTEILPPKKTVYIDSVRKGMTQTALTLILCFGLCTEEERAPIADKLCELIEDFGGKMSTGFLGTPYILHALSENGKADVAYKLLFNEGVPSWLYSVNHGATTMWEHWNSLKEDGSFWSTDMNSFNHYAYGAVGDWLYGAVSGIRINDGGAGYKDITIEPLPDRRLGFARTELDTPQGRLVSYWYYKGERICFEFVVPEGTAAKIKLPNGYVKNIRGGSCNFEI